MKLIVSKLVILLPVFILFAFGCSRSMTMSVPHTMPGTGTGPYTPGQPATGQGLSTIFVENTNGTDDGVRRLLGSMQDHGINFYQTAASPHGLIASNDVVLLKINAKWAERGGTNTDLIRGVIQAVLDHPGGFRGEIIVAV